jgi:superfamily II DNA or RNA helicase
VSFSESVTLVATNQACQIVGLLDKDFRDLMEAMSFENPYRQRQASGFKIPARTYLLSHKGVFWVGLLSDVRRFLKQRDIRYAFDDRRLKLPMPSAESVAQDLDLLPVNLRPYQIDAFHRVIAAQFGILQMATGGGKSVILSAALYALDRNTLIIVNAKDLAVQLQSEIADYLGLQKDQVGFVGDGVFSPKKWTVALVQSLTNGRLGKQKKEAVKRLMDETEILFVDEAHHVQATSYKKVIRGCKNVMKRIGFTATPMTSKQTVMKVDVETQKKKRTEETHEIVLKAHLGPLIGSVTTLDLIEMGYLSTPVVKFIKNKVFNDGVMLSFVEEFERIIVKDEARNRIICSIIKYHYDRDEQSIGFVTRIEHGEELFRMLTEDFGIPESHVAWVSGQDDSKERRASLTEFSGGNTPILLGTVLNEGLNFFCHAGINCSAGNSDIKAIQRLGRILRKPRTSTGDVDCGETRHVTFYDFEDKGHAWFAKHGKTRKSLLEREGHKVITEPDFKWLERGLEG